MRRTTVRLRHISPITCTLVVAGDEGIDMRLELIDALEGRTAQRLSGRIENQISIWLSHDVWVGV